VRAVIISGPQGRACNSVGPQSGVLLRTVPDKRRSGAFEDGLEDGDPVLFEVAHLVAEHLAEVGAEQQVQTERWWAFGRRCGGSLLERLCGGGCFVHPCQLREACGDQGADRFGRLEVADRGISRPRDREVDGRCGAGEDLVQRQASAGTQDR
jgi:hypothetical protein